MQDLKHMVFSLNQKARETKSDTFMDSKFQSALICASLIGLNICLIMFSTMYWLNDSFHSLMAGEPL